MRQFIDNFSVGWIDSINAFLCRLVSWFTLFMVLLTLLIVVLRYGFNLGWIAMQESVMYLHGMVFLLGAAHTLRVNGHVRVDIFYRRFSPNKQAKVDIFGSLFLLMPVNIFIFIVSFDYVMRAWRVMEASQEAGGIPGVFLLKSLILLFSFTMLLQGIAEVIRNVAKLTLDKPLSKAASK
ncbi:TRAP transporter small permease subunit [Paraglaciecola sp. MB-3u-78]|uniref:TRAP transporter small permease subunit n=1 Tax=Paraglaciecola sp. MB-3u-78 TaxID=2058332 RepID=UPI000C327F47|nr:TRAP transporter small permease subunit [Paraglaciecola sp. MB-3u-78]PKG98257.1 permease [Paraglaciecola sp. MB-3u-78]